VSDVYELKFEKLSVNIFDRTINVYNATMVPREKPLNAYPYINSSFRLTTEKLTLKNVELFTLLDQSQLKLERISISKPDVELVLAGNKHLFLPFKDSTAVAQAAGHAKKKFIESFLLSEFQLIDASFHVTNFKKQREFKINEFNISLHDLLINQQVGKDIMSLKQAELSMGGLNGVLKKGAMKRVSFKDFKIGIDSLSMLMTPDTLLFHFRDLNTGSRCTAMTYMRCAGGQNPSRIVFYGRSVAHNKPL